MNVILVRHGETDLNRARILQPPDTPLSALGRRQAEAVAHRLAGEPVDAIISSDMSRAAQTAEALATKISLAVTYDPVLHERNFGTLRGQRFSDLGFDPMAPDYEPPDGESWPAFFDHVGSAFHGVIERARDHPRTVVVFSHGLVIREMIKRHLASSAPVPERLANTSVTIFEKTAPYPVRLMACDQHLAALDDSRTCEGGLA